jgi:hypothetical protein
LANLGQQDLYLRAHFGRFSGGIWSHDFSDTFFQTSFSSISSPILRLASIDRRSSGWVLVSPGGNVIGPEP